jgi:hypothetical protein
MVEPFIHLVYPLPPSFLPRLLWTCAIFVLWCCMATIGHSPGSCCFHFPSANLLLSGDTLFHQSIGRTDLMGGGMSLGPFSHQMHSLKHFHLNVVHRFLSNSEVHSTKVIQTGRRYQGHDPLFSAYFL